jgi:hypothetical protein
MVAYSENYNVNMYYVTLSGSLITESQNIKVSKIVTEEISKKKRQVIFG